jgi:hypothetical protein
MLLLVFYFFLVFNFVIFRFVFSSLNSFELCVVRAVCECFVAEKWNDEWNEQETSRKDIFGMVFLLPC